MIVLYDFLFDLANIQTYTGYKGFSSMQCRAKKSLGASNVALLLTPPIFILARETFLSLLSLI